MRNHPVTECDFSFIYIWFGSAPSLRTPCGSHQPLWDSKGSGATLCKELIKTDSISCSITLPPADGRCWEQTCDPLTVIPSASGEKQWWNLETIPKPKTGVTGHFTLISSFSDYTNFKILHSDWTFTYNSITSVTLSYTLDVHSTLYNSLLCNITVSAKL